MSAVTPPWSVEPELIDGPGGYQRWLLATPSVGSRSLCMDVRVSVAIRAGSGFRRSPQPPLDTCGHHNRYAVRETR